MVTDQAELLPVDTPIWVFWSHSTSRGWVTGHTEKPDHRTGGTFWMYEVLLDDGREFTTLGTRLVRERSLNDAD